jgi:hypothetical protein
MCVRAVIELGLAAGSTYSKNLPELMDMFSNEDAFISLRLNALPLVVSA